MDMVDVLDGVDAWEQRGVYWKKSERAHKKRGPLFGPRSQKAHSEVYSLFGLDLYFYPEISVAGWKSSAHHLVAASISSAFTSAGRVRELLKEPNLHSEPDSPSSLCSSSLSPLIVSWLPRHADIQFPHLNCGKIGFHDDMALNFRNIEFREVSEDPLPVATRRQEPSRASFQS